MNVYVISGKDPYRIRECLNSLLRQNSIAKENTVWIDADSPKTFQLENALMQCYGNSLFDTGETRAVILKNPYFLNASVKETSPKKAGGRKKAAAPDEKDRRNDVLEQYLRAPDSGTFLFFFCSDYDADSRKKEFKLLQKYNDKIGAQIDG